MFQPLFLKMLILSPEDTLLWCGPDILQVLLHTCHISDLLERILLTKNVFLSVIQTVTVCFFLFFFCLFFFGGGGGEGGGGLKRHSYFL